MVKHFCGTCNKNVGQNSVQCLFCELWHHGTLDCLPWFQTDAGVKEMLHSNQIYASFICGKCKIIMAKVNKRITAVEKDVVALKATTEALTQGQAKADEERESLKKEVDSLSKKLKDVSINSKSLSLLSLPIRKAEKKTSSFTVSRNPMTKRMWRLLLKPSAQLD